MTGTAPVTMTCIGCPLGCRLDVELLDGGAWKIEGYECKKGKEYAAQEAVDPTRMLTTTVAVEGAIWRRLPVCTARPIPKDRLLQACRELHRLHLTAPVVLGQVVLDDAAGTGVPVVATRSLPAVAPVVRKLS